MHLYDLDAGMDGPCRLCGHRRADLARLVVSSGSNETHWFMWSVGNIEWSISAPSIPGVSIPRCCSPNLLPLVEVMDS